MRTRTLIRATVLAAFAAAVLSGCAATMPGTPVGMQSPSTSTTTQPTPVGESNPYDLPQSAVDETFLDVVRENAPEFAGDSDAFLIAGAHANCDLLRDGTTFVMLVYSWADQGYSGQASGTLIGAGTIAYCPDMQGAVS